MNATEASCFFALLNICHFVHNPRPLTHSSDSARQDFKAIWQGRQGVKNLPGAYLQTKQSGAIPLMPANRGMPGNLHQLPESVAIQVNKLFVITCFKIDVATRIKVVVDDGL